MTLAAIVIGGAILCAVITAASLLRCPKCRRWHQSQAEEAQCEGGRND